MNICPCVKVSVEARRGCCILNSWSNRLLWATLWIVGTDRRSWDRAASSLIHQAILIAPDFIVNTVLKSWHSLSFPSIFISITGNLPLNNWYLKKKKEKENMKWSHFFCLKYRVSFNGGHGHCKVPWLLFRWYLFVLGFLFLFSTKDISPSKQFCSESYPFSKRNENVIS